MFGEGVEYVLDKPLTKSLMYGSDVSTCGERVITSIRTNLRLCRRWSGDMNRVMLPSITRLPRLPPVGFWQMYNAARACTICFRTEDSPFDAFSKCLTALLITPFCMYRVVVTPRAAHRRHQPSRSPSVPSSWQ